MSKLNVGDPVIANGRYGEVVEVSADHLWYVVKFSLHGAAWTLRFPASDLEQG